MHEAKAIGLSVPSGILWDVTAPTPYAEESAANLIGSVGSWCVKTFAEAICSLASWMLLHSWWTNSTLFQPATMHLVAVAWLTNLVWTSCCSCSFYIKDILTLTRRIRDKYIDARSKTRFKFLVTEQVDFASWPITDWMIRLNSIQSDSIGRRLVCSGCNMYRKHPSSDSV